MNFIILDLEWDSAYCKKKNGFINQIIQIGAVKLDENLNFIDNFNRTVRSSVSKKVTKRFTELTGITTEDMLSGIPLDSAVSEYNEWVGDDFVTLTWSNSDLYAIISNVKFLLSDGLQFKTGNYVDLQSFVQNELRLSGHEINNQISLSSAAEMLGISTDMFELHTALD
ncbi:MAG: exonuclease domain-containing protein, partial [Clostridia bacterium]|nr:exonuclease domain-containing protein [Clostridia bacterium]